MLPLASCWRDKAPGFCDDALRGSSSLRAAVLRSIADVRAQLRGPVSRTILWDMMRSYVSLLLPLLARHALKLKLPAVILHQVLLGYSACRTLRSEVCFSVPVAPLISIVARWLEDKRAQDDSCTFKKIAGAGGDNRPGEPRPFVKNWAPLQIWLGALARLDKDLHLPPELRATRKCALIFGGQIRSAPLRVVHGPVATVIRWNRSASLCAGRRQLSLTFLGRQRWQLWRICALERWLGVMAQCRGWWFQ